MSRIGDIFTKARRVLADTAGTRYSDAQLLGLLDDAQKEAVLYANLLRTKETIPILVGVSEYSIPDDCYRIIRILVDGEAVPLTSHEEMDRLQDEGLAASSATGWEDYTASEVTRIITDKLNYDKIKIYPIPDTASENSFTLEAALQVPEDPLYDVIYGITIGATGYTVNSNLGFTVDFSDDFTNTFVDSTTGDDSVYGLMTMFEDNAKGITIYYLKRPEEITATTDILEIDTAWDIALHHYVAGMALRYNKDTQDRQMGAEELQLFSASVSEMRKSSSNDFLATRTQYQSSYNTGFNE